MLQSLVVIAFGVDISATLGAFKTWLEVLLLGWGRRCCVLLLLEDAELLVEVFDLQLGKVYLLRSLNRILLPHPHLG